MEAPLLLQIYVKGELFKHGNPRKRSINKEIGFRIRKAIGGQVAKSSDGKSTKVPVYEFDNSRLHSDGIVRGKANEMIHKPDTPEGVKELSMLMEGEHVSWTRKSPQVTRDIDIYLETLTPEQEQRLNEIEQELLDMAYKAEEETRTKTVLKGK